MSGNRRGDDSASDWWGWGASMVADLQQQTQELVEATKNDLGVFVDTVTTESQNIAQDTASVAAETMAKHVPKEAEEFFHSLDLPRSTSRNSRRKEQTSYPPPQKQRASPTKKPATRYTRRDLHILQLQSTPTTFIADPDNGEAFRKWQVDNPFMTKRKAEIETLRSQSNSIANMEANLVPNAVSFEVFWKRYFFQVDMFDRGVQQREEIKRAMESDLQKNDSEGWGEDDDDWSDGEGEWEDGGSTAKKESVQMAKADTYTKTNTDRNTSHDDDFGATDDRSDMASAEQDVLDKDSESAAEQDEASGSAQLCGSQHDPTVDPADDAENTSPNIDSQTAPITTPEASAAEESIPATQPQITLSHPPEPQRQTQLQPPQPNTVASDGVLSAVDTGSERDDETDTPRDAYAHGIESETTAFPGSETTEPEVETDGDRSAWGEESDTLDPNWSHAEDQGQSDGRRPDSANGVDGNCGDDQWEESVEDGWGESAAEDGAGTGDIEDEVGYTETGSDYTEGEILEPAASAGHFQQEGGVQELVGSEAQQAEVNARERTRTPSPPVERQAVEDSEGSDSDWEKWE